MKFSNFWDLKSYLQNNQHRIDLWTEWLCKIYYIKLSKMGSWIAHNSVFDGQPCFPHGMLGIFVSGGSKIGKNAVIFQHVTIGSNTLHDSDKFGSPEIGDNVYIGAGAKIIGLVKIGNNCRIGANAIIYKDLPENSVAVQSPTRIVQKDNLDNRFFSMNSNKEWVYFNNGKWESAETLKNKNQ
ncbi:serine acetyltransferase [Bacteroidia bacterium]|nr:serine acetyltransferase [Bacteroidia bacterium]